MRLRCSVKWSALALCGAVWLLRGGAAAAQHDAEVGPQHDAAVEALDGGAPLEHGSVPLEHGSADPRTARVEALIEGDLALDVEAQSLFDVPLEDEVALQVEAARVRALLRSVEQASLPTPGEVAAPRGKRRAAVEPRVPQQDAAAQVDRHTMDSAEGRARLALDRVRAAFYALPLAVRSVLLQEHEAKREAARPKESEVARATREAQRERERALDSVRAARSEAERLVAEELARLIDLQRATTVTQARFSDERAALSARRDGVLGWQRRVRDAKAGSTDDADQTYDALRRTLRVARDELAAALDQLGSARSAVPELGPNRLQEIPSGIPITHASERRATLEAQHHTALAQESALREERASTLLEETTALNRERLGLLPRLSSQKRSAITGWTAAGADQARSEARQLVLILRYHRHVAVRSLGRLRGDDKLEDSSVWHILLTAVPGLLVLGLFVWGRRKTPAMFEELERRIADQDRSEHRVTASLTRRAVRFGANVHRPLEWLALFWVALWLLPGGAQELLELQLLSVIIGWSLAGSLIVDVVNALATDTTAPSLRATEDSNQLRLRSLRLVGRVIVAFALVLLLSARLVGEGTVYSWVASTCWFAAIPVFLVLVRWWRETVFIRIERIRRKSELQAWILANRDGWKSFFAAMLAAVQLFSVGMLKTARNWLAGFELARRADAYLFKRGLDRMADDQKAEPTHALSTARLDSLSPDRAGAGWVSTSTDEQIEALAKRCESGEGGVTALIAPRGMGKTAALRRLAVRVPGALLLTGTHGLDAASVSESVHAHATSGLPLALVILDDAHVFVKPLRDGLQTFDELLSLARHAERGVMWVFVLDAVVWPYLQRARDSRPLFDQVVELEPWSDDEIGELLALRSEEAGFTATFEDLLEKLPPSADEIDKLEALAAKRAGYVRVVWDYARGNPGLALEVWRRSLVQDAEGSVRARPLRAPQSAQLERLPDASLFILRAVLQLAPASAADVVSVTRLTEAQVLDAFELGQRRGYLTQQHGGVEVTWAWLRLVLLLLERRHLLVNR